MYESFFHFHDRPFAAVPEARRYFPAATIEEARQTLLRLIERADGPGLVIGPAGTGKSLLCHVLAAHCRASYDVVLLASARLCTRRALLQNILFELNLPYREREEGELRLSLIDHLQPGPRCPNGMLLLVDEAHTLPLRLLEEIRMITNLVREGQTRVRLVLAGGPQLEERFAHPKLESFNQRLAARCYLQPMNRQETAEYVRFQIRAVSGQAERIFSPDALHAVFQATDGVPRLVNQVCDHALLLACEAGRHQIDAGSVETAWADLQRLPIPWQPETTAVQVSNGVIEFGQLSDEVPIVPIGPISSIGPSGSTGPSGSSGSGNSPLRIARPNGVHAQAAASPAGGGAKPGPATDPFAGVFEEEEEIVDRYATLDAARSHAPATIQGIRPGGEPRVSSRETASAGQSPSAAEHATADAVDTTHTPPHAANQPAAIRIQQDAQPVVFEACEPHDESSFQVVEFAHPAYATALAEQVEPASREPAETGRKEAVPADDDRTMIVVADEPHVQATVPVGRGRAERRDYRQLFARLRNQ